MDLLKRLSPPVDCRTKFAKLLRKLGVPLAMQKFRSSLLALCLSRMPFWKCTRKVTRKVMLLCHAELLCGCACAPLTFSPPSFLSKVATQVSRGGGKGKILTEWCFPTHANASAPLFNHTCERGRESIPPFENLLTLLLSIVKCLREDLDKTLVSGT